MTREEFDDLKVGDKIIHAFGGIGIVTEKEENGYTVKDKGFDCGDGLDEVSFAWNEGELMPLKKETKWTEHTLQRDKDGFLVGEVSDLDVYLPFEVHDNKYDTWEVIEDDSALVDWSGDIDTKPRYDRIRTWSKLFTIKQKGGEQC